MVVGLDSRKVRRCGIFLFFDKDGVVDEYILELLRDLRQNVDHLLVVCNGYVQKTGREQMLNIADDLICRANVGFDVGGYREGLFYLGWKYLEQFDEIVMMNYTFFGPFYPFKEMFDEMAKRDVSFWGITKHHKVEFDPFHALPYDYLPEHIQSHFLVLRKDLFMSYQYRDFIFNMKNPESYLESICGYEAIFTKHFADMGFRWDVYVNTDKYEGYSYFPLMFYAKEIIQETRCPIIKRRSFFTDYSDYLDNTCGESSMDFYEYLKESGIYDLDLIWDNILRLENITAIHRVLHLNYILDTDQTDFTWNRKIAVVIFADSVRRAAWYRKYLRALPENVDVYVYGEEQVCAVIKEMCGASANIVCKKTDETGISKKINIAAKELRKQRYDYVGVLHMKDVEQEQPYSNDVSWQYSDWENTAGNAYVIGNIVQAFEENKRMGMCIPPIPCYGTILKHIGKGWCGKYQFVREYLQSKGIAVSLNEKMAPLAPFGGSFWMRGDVFGQLADLDGNSDDDVYLMALPFITQSLGAYTGIGYSEQYIPVEITNQDYMLRENNQVLFEKYGANYHKVVVERIYSGSFI